MGSEDVQSLGTVFVKDGVEVRCHNVVLTAKSLSVTDRDFITRMIYKDIY